MKYSIFTVLTLLAALHELPAQTPFYLEFDPECINQLEYKYTYKEQNLLMYSVPKGENELYIFVIGDKEPATTAQLPKGTVSCKSDEINATLVDNINGGGRLAYLVFKTQNGYISFPIESAGHIVRSGTYFAFRSPHYDFVMDTSSINYARNLSRPGIASPVYLTGKRSQECLQLYAFRLEPSESDMPRSDVEIIPGLGIISNRMGRNGSEMEQNVYRLLKVNSISLEDYIYAACHHPENKDSSSLFITTLPPGANPNDAFKVENPFIEPDKEGYQTQTPGANGKLPLADCPTPPGYGYHIVQPGDSLGAIARAYNVSTQSLLQWNKLSDAKQIKTCDKIWVVPQPSATPASIPAPATGYHVVQKGETLYSIARKYNVTVANIRQWNNLKSDDIQLGQQLAVTATKQAAPTGAKNTPAATTAQPVAQGSSPQGRLTHKTRQGETLSRIAWRYGYTAPYLRHINRNNPGLPPGNDDMLTEGLLLIVSDSKCDREDFTSYLPPAPGQEMNIPSAVTPPPPAGKTVFEYVGEYIVKDGDTLASIARQYGLTQEKLAAANNLKPGQQPAPRSILKIPK